MSDSSFRTYKIPQNFNFYTKPTKTSLCSLHAPKGVDFRNIFAEVIYPFMNKGNEPVSNIENRYGRPKNQTQISYATIVNSNHNTKNAIRELGNKFKGFYGLPFKCCLGLI